MTRIAACGDGLVCGEGDIVGGVFFTDAQEGDEDAIILSVDSGVAAYLFGFDPQATPIMEVS